ncbi:imidazolonepropionase [Segatella baroniae F0067]|uniref:Imidazolonepropionase n=1 Tax=Segatella baroniae F0067 TaxID=1115809 RepID=U2P862_9BACT|nr:imidazolonepropionase [Segatella baroniae]ERK39894.1 imidazolonepropionase [Segatella baroniae F0067]
MKQIVTNIGLLAGVGHEGKRCLKGKEMAQLNTIANAYLAMEGGRIADYGAMAACPGLAGVEVIDAKGGAVLPSWCDSHTHIVYAGSREQEFVDKIRGLSYAEIAQRGGGILNSADRLHEMSEEELYRQAMRRVDEVIRKGTGCVEIKSGYGLNTEGELKMLRVIRRIKETTRLKVVSTFLGAHAVSRAYKGRQGDYVDLVVNEMIPAVGAEKLADFIDVFCDTGFFTPEETARILEAGAAYGMRPKIHADELASSGGVEVGVRHDALSVDHLESMTEEEIELLLDSQTIPTALPGTSFFLNMPFALGRKMIDRGLPLALASDYNPGSTPSGDMKFIVSLACIKMRLLPAEAINAATFNGACAMGLSDDYGSITRGKVANFFITDPLPSMEFIPYAYTTPLVRRVFLQGVEYK